MNKKPRKLINAEGTNKRRATLEQKARAAGWDNLSACLTAVGKNEVELPQKPNYDAKYGAAYEINQKLPTGA